MQTDCVSLPKDLDVHPVLESIISQWVAQQVMLTPHAVMTDSGCVFLCVYELVTLTYVIQSPSPVDMWKCECSVRQIGSFSHRLP